MPEAVATASSACSSAATLCSRRAVVGLPQRPYNQRSLSPRNAAPASSALPRWNALERHNAPSNACDSSRCSPAWTLSVENPVAFFAATWLRLLVRLLALAAATSGFAHLLPSLD